MEAVIVYNAATGLCREVYGCLAAIRAKAKANLAKYAEQFGYAAAIALRDEANERIALYEPEETEPQCGQNHKRESLADIMRGIRKLGGINPASVGASWVRDALRDAKSSGIIRKAGKSLDDMTRALWLRGLLGKPDQEPDMWETVNAIENYYQAA